MSMRGFIWRYMALYGFVFTCAICYMRLMLLDVIVWRVMAR